ncbi:hypothetical protein MMC13_001200 [Lambiella insularis]|nr:hypothetical protein [Lambiella insularis]
MVILLSSRAVLTTLLYGSTVLASGVRTALKLNSTILNFDDVKTKHGIGDISSTVYSYLSFVSFDVFAPKDPYIKKLISDHDLNCATSPPNAIIGSRGNYGGSSPAAIEIANATSMTASGLLPYFSLLSFSIKPMDAPDASTTIYLKGYSNATNSPMNWTAEFPTGYHLPFQANLKDHSHESWDNLNRVEMWAEFGEDALDWEFCIDDLEVQFSEAPDSGKKLVKQAAA